MTGTALTDQIELAEVYRLGCLKIPTNKPCQRVVQPDLIFATEHEKWAAVIEETKQAIERGQAVLIGTRSIDKSNLLSDLLHQQKIKHVVLNAHQEQREAEIIKHAGEPGHVTVATNMRGAVPISNLIHRSRQREVCT